MRSVFGLAALALVGCVSAEGAHDQEDVGGSDDALTALEDEIGFDGAIGKLDITTLESIDAESRTLEAAGHSEGELDRTATRSTLTAVLRQRKAKATGIHAQLDLYDTDLFKLNGLEQKLCSAHRIVCVRVAIAAFKARGASQAEYRDGNVGGRIDCFRHTYWNAAMTRAVGADYAKQWADAHENGYPENRATAKDRLLSDMDFFNNDVGRKIGKAHEDDSDGDTKQAVRDAISKGDVRAVRYDLGDANGKLVPSSQCTDRVRCGT
ncbi:MAG: hypothetical protein U0270_02630 [Labilithrix sp.]